MIVFSRPPGWRRRADDVWTSSSGADAPPVAAKSDPPGGLAGSYAHLARNLNDQDRWGYDELVGLAHRMFEVQGGL